MALGARGVVRLDRHGLEVDLVRRGGVPVVVAGYARVDRGLDVDELAVLGVLELFLLVLLAAAPARSTIPIGRVREVPVPAAVTRVEVFGWSVADVAGGDARADLVLFGLVGERERLVAEVPQHRHGAVGEDGEVDLGVVVDGPVGRDHLVGDGGLVVAQAAVGLEADAHDRGQVAAVVDLVEQDLRVDGDARRSTGDGRVVQILGAGRVAEDAHGHVASEAVVGAEGHVALVAVRLGGDLARVHHSSAADGEVERGFAGVDVRAAVSGVRPGEPEPHGVGAREQRLAGQLAVQPAERGGVVVRGQVGLRQRLVEAVDVTAVGLLRGPLDDVVALGEHPLVVVVGTRDERARKAHLAQAPGGAVLFLEAEADLERVAGPERAVPVRAARHAEHFDVDARRELVRGQRRRGDRRVRGRLLVARAVVGAGREPRRDQRNREEAG